MIVIYTGYFERILEPDVDNMIRDVRCVLNKNDNVYSFNINEDMEYQGEIDEPAGIIGGKIEVIADVDKPSDAADEIFNTFWAYQDTARVEIDF